MKERSKTGLFLMELILMILLFAAAAAICMRVFAAAQIRNNHSSELSNASLKVQSAAECWKLTGGDAGQVAALLDGTETDRGMALFLDRDWQRCGEEAACYVLELSESGADAEIGVLHVGADGSPSGDAIFSLTVKAVPNGK